MARQPRRMLALRAERQAAAAAAEAAADGDGWPTLGETLGAAGGVALGVALGAHASVFAWRAGDVLLIDNRRVMHDGRPASARASCAPSSSTRSRCRRRWSGGVPGCLTRGRFSRENMVPLGHCGSFAW